MKYIKVVLYVIGVLFFLFFPQLIEFFISFNNNTVPPFEIQRYMNKFLLVVKMNISYYTSIAAFALAYVTYLSNAKQREKDEKKYQDQLIQEQIKENHIKEKELSKYWDQFRPTFLENGDTLILLMRDNNYYLRNVRWYPSPEDIGIEIKNIMSGDKIYLNVARNNYFITAETMLGEKIIFGKILNNIHIYKALKEGCSPIPPNTPEKYNNDTELREILNNWIPFNTMEKNKNSTLKEVDKLFMYRTTLAREVMGSNSVEFKKELASIVSTKLLFDKVLHYMTDFEPILSDYVKIKVLEELIKILEENESNITINLSELKSDKWEYLNKQIFNIENELKKENSLPASLPAYTIFNNIKNNHSDLKSIICVFAALVDDLKIDEDVNNKLIDYTDRILRNLEN